MACEDLVNEIFGNLFVQMLKITKIIHWYANQEKYQNQRLETYIDI